ncbi:hypothetical protein P1J78_20735 [Psychromarinibacter sp. C21-152]|uniref:Uncharacterized protein n=1 Tax=Psychromarinibacter sediminicola TaxID=3033385 RepID=A0AAE3TC14_9RHOB|nr:hypothetical protein [Psychromarinibacter sediminicola]
MEILVSGYGDQVSARWGPDMSITNVWKRKQEEHRAEAPDMLEGEQLVPVASSPPLADCNPGTVGLNIAYRDNIENEICLSNAPRSVVRVEAETRYTGATEALKWHVFDETGTTAVAVCYCLR